MLPIANYTPEGELKVNLYPYQKTITSIIATYSGSLSIPNNTYTQMQFDADPVDNLGEFDTSTYTFTPQVTGVYKISLSWLLTTGGGWADTEYTTASIYINGSAQRFIHLSSGRTAGSYAHTHGSTLIHLTAGDAVTFYIYQNSGAALNTQASTTWNWIGINYIPNSAIVVDGIGSINLIDSYVATGSVASVTFSNIPGTYRHLMLVGSIRTDNANESDVAMIRFNDDSGSNYDYLFIFFYSGAAPAATTTTRAGTNARFFYVEGANSRASNFGGGTAYVFDYANIAKEAHWSTVNNARYGDRSIDADLILWQGGGAWRSVATINKLSFTPLTGSNFVAGTSIQLYGVS